MSDDTQQTADVPSPSDEPQYRSPIWWAALRRSDPKRWAKEIERDDAEKAAGLKPRGEAATMREEIADTTRRLNALDEHLRTQIPSLLDAIQAQFDSYEKELATLKASIPEVVTRICEATDKKIEAASVRTTLDLEREFGGALARAPLNLDTERRAARSAEHLQRLETRVQALERK